MLATASQVAEMGTGRAAPCHRASTGGWAGLQIFWGPTSVAKLGGFLADPLTGMQARTVLQARSTCCRVQRDAWHSRKQREGLGAARESGLPPPAAPCRAGEGQPPRHAADMLCVTRPLQTFSGPKRDTECVGQVSPPCIPSPTAPSHVSI